ncbi:chromosomal replication initiator protein [Succinivibrio dextrinosolvens DSM 3072]|uniref:Chromosomal replication initiator protein DnaA n=1 Tax=Succinivibrio dextrinosolvens DSM 3072 TaxID=1123324 RepID=A0A1T4V2N7_9GAMM|nr:chromosomal replication initiator protein DnaA [Succinivibrio dextrinosolvens]SKA59212.1 chromosomal replication initiator protein [Succinivibrio dextrinosolvens DSM 3072]
MDLVQIWHDAIQNLKQSINDPQKQAIYGLIEFQSSIQIIGSDLCFICNNDFMMKLMSEFSPSLYMEISRLLGNNSLGLKLLLASELQNSQNNNQVQPANFGFQNEPNTQVNNSFNPNPNPINQQPSNVVPVQNAPAHNMVRADNINPEKTFENYVTDPENSLVYAIAQKIAQNPGSESYNPFYVYGGSGLGKTHLLWAIANRIRATKPEISVVYIRAEEFIRKFVESMSKTGFVDQQVKFQDSFTQHDVFIMDDIQSLTKGEKSRDTFFEIIANYLDKPGSQLILASDVAPGNLKNFHPRLVSRFGSGVCREIYPPSAETRAAITLRKCKELDIQLDHDVVDYIANNIRSSVREIEGAIKTLKQHIEITGKQISCDDAVKLLSNLVNIDRQVTSIDAIKDRVAKEYGVTVSSMESAERKKATSLARSMAMTLANDLIPNLSLNDIGRAFNKDHSSVHEAIKRTREKIGDDREEQSAIYQRLILSLKKE